MLSRPAGWEVGHSSKSYCSRVSSVHFEGSHRVLAIANLTPCLVDLEWGEGTGRRFQYAMVKRSRSRLRFLRSCRHPSISLGQGLKNAPAKLSTRYAPRFELRSAAWTAPCRGQLQPAR